MGCGQLPLELGGGSSPQKNTKLQERGEKGVGVGQWS